MRFPAIEGLRAWLAWAVVLDHLAYWSDRWGRVGELLRSLGHPAVFTFCIISGFVICHLILTKPEPYARYIMRRFFRLFPLFIVTCIAGHFAYRLQVQLPDPDFAPDFMMWLRRTVEDTEQHFWAHVAAHLTMLYGVLSQDWLPSTDVAFNMPAWSISLEWQFYLIAPFVVWLLVKRPGLAPMLALTLVVLQMLFYRGWFGSYHQLATLLAVSGLFAVGVASRMIYPTLTEGRIKSFHVPLAGCIVLAAFTNEMALAIWAMVYIGFIVRQPSRIYQYALESPIVLYLGSRSYGVYLVHFIVLVVVQHVTTRLLGTAPQFLALTAMVVPATLLLSELMYRMVELPGIRLGSRLCRKLQPDKRAVFRRAA